jgi:Flp pilus assembly protein TadD
VSRVRAAQLGVGRVIDAAMKRGPLSKTWADALALNRSRDLGRAAQLRSQGRYEEAARVVEFVLSEEPKNPRAQWMSSDIRVAPDVDRAEALWAEARRDEAIEALRDLAERLPNESEVHLRLAPMLVVEGDYQGAATHARRAVELEPDDPNVLFRAAAKARWGDAAASRSYLEQAKAILAQTTDGAFFPFDDEILHLEGVLAFDEGRPHVGLAYLERAAALQPHEVSVGGDLAQAYLHHGRVDDAIDVIREKLAHHPGDERLLRIYNDIERWELEQTTRPPSNAPLPPLIRRGDQQKHRLGSRDLPGR